MLRKMANYFRPSSSSSSPSPSSSDTEEEGSALLDRRRPIRTPSAPSREVWMPRFSRFGALGFSGIPALAPGFNLPKGESRALTANHVTQWALRSLGFLLVMYAGVSTANTFFLSLLQQRRNNPAQLADSPLGLAMSQSTDYAAGFSVPVTPTPDMLAAMRANAQLNPFSPLIDELQRAREYNQPFDSAVLAHPKVLFLGILFPLIALVLYVGFSQLHRLKPGYFSHYDWNNPRWQSLRAHGLAVLMQTIIQTTLSCLAGASVIKGCSTGLLLAAFVLLRPVANLLVVVGLRACKIDITATGDLENQDSIYRLVYAHAREQDQMELATSTHRAIEQRVPTVPAYRTDRALITAN